LKKNESSHLKVIDEEQNKKIDKTHQDHAGQVDPKGKIKNKRKQDKRD
jgi:hypothetical protein